MAINLTDFDKIWASTSPLTPYAFSDANYKQGWNFVGATPPARQMWDSFMKLSDEKSQWLYNNKLSLSGGTMTGQINMNGKSINLGAGSDSDGRIYNISNTLRLTGGNNTSNGSFIDIGTPSATNQGVKVTAKNTTNETTLLTTPDGGLWWNDVRIGLQNGTYSVGFYGFGYITSGGTALDLSFPYIVKGKNILFNSLTATVRSYKGYLTPGYNNEDILTGATQGTWYKKDSMPCVFRLIRSGGWGASGENNTIVVGELTANITVQDE